MIKELRRHWLAYVCLVVLLSGTGTLYALAWPSRPLQHAAAILLGVSYAAWGIFFHVKTQVRSSKVMWEYAFFGLFATTALILITL